MQVAGGDQRSPATIVAEPSAYSTGVSQPSILCSHPLPIPAIRLQGSPGPSFVTALELRQPYAKIGKRGEITVVMVTRLAERLRPQRCPWPHSGSQTRQQANSLSYTIEEMRFAISSRMIALHGCSSSRLSVANDTGWTRTMARTRPSVPDRSRDGRPVYGTRRSTAVRRASEGDRA